MLLHDERWGHGSNEDHGHECGVFFHGSEDETGTMADGHTTLDGNVRCDRKVSFRGESLGEN